MIHQTTTFTEFKRNFYSRVKDLTIFDCGDFNLLKVVLDGLKVNYAKRSKNKKEILLFLLPEFVIILLDIYHWINSLYDKILHRKKYSSTQKNKPKYLLIDMGGFTLVENKHVLTFYDKIIKYYQRENCFVIFNGPKESTYYQQIQQYQLHYLYDAIAVDEEYKSAYKICFREGLLLKRKLYKAYEKIDRSGLFNKDELFNIAYAINLFFKRYIFYSNFFRAYSFKKTFVISSYHNEPLIYYLKQKGIEAIELQHGLIAKSDIFYVFPDIIKPIKQKCLFPDKILVFGEYWKNILLCGNEFDPNQIEIIGDFMAGSMHLLPHHTDIPLNKKIIIVATQTYLHEIYSKYIHHLAKIIANDTNWHIIVKLHPSERIENYSSIKDLAGIQIIKDIDLNYLLSHSQIVISIYSTLLFDAIKHQVIRFSLQIEGFFDYTSDIISDGIAHPLSWNENPIKKMEYLFQHHDILQQNKKEFFYDKFQPQILP